jgi:hypothetical protein
MSKILNLRAWQLFLLLTAPLLLSTILDSYWSMVFVQLIYFGWVYAIGSSMNKRIPLSQRPRSIYFKLSCVYCVIVFGSNVLSVPQPTNVIWQTLDIIFKLYTLWSWIYIVVFAARMLESVIEGRVVGISDSMKAIVCLIAFPWGVWTIQPAVKRVLIKYKATQDSHIH